MLELFVSLMIWTSNNNQFAATSTGDYYEVTKMDYEASSNTTYALFSRYYVNGGYQGTTKLHFQVRPYAGKVTKEYLLKDAQERSYPWITVVSAF